LLAETNQQTTIKPT